MNDLESQTNPDSGSRINQNQTGSRGPTNLGGLFAGGMPTLRPTNSRFSSNSSTNRQNTGMIIILYIYDPIRSSSTYIIYDSTVQ